MNSADFNQQIAQPLERQRRRLRMLRAADGTTVTAALLVGVLALQLLLDWWLRLRVDMRGALLLLVAASAGWAAWRFVLAPLRLRFGVREMALALEQRHPELNAVLLSAVDFSAGRVGDPSWNSPQLVGAVVDQAVQATRGISFDQLINTRRSRWSLARGLAVLGVVVFAFAAAPQTMGIWVDRNLLLRNVSWPQRTLLIVEAPGDGILRGAIGDDIEVRAHVADGYQPPRQVEIVFTTASGARGRETMTGVGERGFRMVFARARESFEFYLSGGDDQTETFHVQLTERPTIASAELTVEAPAYTGIEPQTYPDGQRAVELYRGSTLTIRALATKDLASAALHSHAALIEQLDARTRTLGIAVKPRESQTYHFALTDRDGLTNTRPMRFSVRIIEDAAPKVSLLAPHVGNLVAPQAVLPLELSFSDELGLAKAILVHQHSGAGGEPVELPVAGFTPGMHSFEAQNTWTVADAGAQVGDAVTLTARAHDFNDVTGPGIGESTTLTFRLATAEELLAEFQRREQEYRRQFERLVDTQERLRRRLLTVLADISDGRVPPDLEANLAPLERQQRQIRQQAGAVQQQFVQVLAEMGINRLDDAETRRRLQKQVIDPLGELFARDLSDAADQLRRLGREQTVALAAAVDPAQALIAEKMQQVLANMLQWEGFQETVGMLREILQLQRELNAETKSTLESRGSEFFED